MSKELFEQYREEEIHSLVSIPYEVYKELNAVWDQEELEDLTLVKHYIPKVRTEAQKNKRWKDLEQTIKECREEQKDIEYEIRRSITEPK